MAFQAPPPDGRPEHRVIKRVEGGGRLVVLTTPKTLESPAAAPHLERARPALLCVDEANCISEWGHDFRPAYLRLGAARERLGSPPALALTATATPRVREDIAARLHLRAPLVLIAPAHRDNLRLAVEIAPGAAKFGAAGRRIRGLRRPGIVYCATTTAVDRLGGALERAGVPVVRYHGKMRAGDRTAAQRRFMHPSRRLIMVATSAFGMGIDNPLHRPLPGPRLAGASTFRRSGARDATGDRRTASSCSTRPTSISRSGSRR